MDPKRCKGRGRGGERGRGEGGGRGGERGHGERGGRGGRGGGGGERRRQGRGRARARRQSVSDEIRATLVDHVLVHGMTMREAGQRVQPNLSRFTVASIIRTFREENRTQRRPPGGGRLRLLSEEQERELVNMVIANNVIRLQEIQRRVIEDDHLFRGINAISLSTIDRILRKNQFRMKQAYRVPFERNSDRVKNQRVEYVQRIFEIEGRPVPHEMIFVDEAGFNLTKRRKRGRNIIGHRAIVNVPGQRGGNVTMCAAISQRGVLHRHAVLGPYNTMLLLAFLDGLRQHMFQLDYREPAQPEQPHYVVVWDNVSFHRAALVRDWFTNNPRFSNIFLPAYSPFLNPIEELFSARRWKVYDREPYVRVHLLQAMEEACLDISVDACQGWIRHARGFYPRCLAGANIACDVDEILWPDPDQRQNAVVG
ncbi:uncharacterized protein LOC109195670 [Oreochromis niloticus]|uniref:uncharacterized protein LOC109195670 n=1 Tax=Oreochromis niloticus TaxID=8128 RepID=UPI0009051BE2|nr:uncharacterized protein LOC109195670 [Oreochromis niloticus]